MMDIRRLRTKITLLVCVIAFLFLVAIIILTNVFISGSLAAAAMDRNAKIAELLSKSVSARVERQAMELALVASGAAAKDEYVGALSMVQTDKAGGRDGKARFGDITYDENSGKWGVPIAVPVKNAKGEVTGVLEALTDIAVFFEPLAGFKTGKTGDAVVVDDKAYLVYHGKAAPFMNKFSEYSELQSCLASRSGWCKTAYRRNQPVLLATSGVDTPYFKDRGTNWYVVVEQDRSEILAPMNTLLAILILLVPFLIAISVLVASVISRAFTAPIGRMREGMRRVGAGELDYRIEERSSDEMGELAGSFNMMADGLRSILQSLAMEFAAAASRLGGIVSGIKGDIKPLLTEAPGQLNEKTKKALDSAENGVDEAAHVISNIIDFAKIEAGKMDTAIAPVDMRTLLKKVVFVTESRIRKKGLDFKFSMPKEDLRVNADAERINQAFVNLIENAIKFTDRGHIEISVKELKYDVECAVADTGIGMAGKKPGLGLSIVKGIIEKHKGKMWVESEAGKGTRVFFTLPKALP